MSPFLKIKIQNNVSTKIWKWSTEKLPNKKIKTKNKKCAQCFFRNQKMNRHKNVSKQIFSENVLTKIKK